jgi:hypothetical protein
MGSSAGAGFAGGFTRYLDLGAVSGIGFDRFRITAAGMYVVKLVIDLRQVHEIGRKSYSNCLLRRYVPLGEQLRTEDHCDSVWQRTSLTKSVTRRHLSVDRCEGEDDRPRSVCGTFV